MVDALPRWSIPRWRRYRTAGIRAGDLAAIALSLCLASAGPPAAETPHPAHRPFVVGYLASWNATPEQIAVIRGDYLTHLIFAFGAVAADGQVSMGNCADPACPEDQALGARLAALADLKRRHPQLRILLALGGWTGSAGFSDAAATPETRRRFADSAADLVFGRLGDVFEGIDVDWEFPVEGGSADTVTRAADRENLTKLMEALRSRLDAVGRPADRRPLLAMATSANPALVRHLELPELARIVDWIGVMAYDYHAGAQITGLNAPLFSTSGTPGQDPSVDSTVRAYLSAGAPASSLVLGVPFYGRAYGNVDGGPEGNGLLQAGEASAAADWGPDGIPIRELTARTPESSGFETHWHAHAQVPWLYNKEKRIWISHEDERSIMLKGEYARLRGLRGVMAWELGGDDGELLRALHRGLHASDPPDRQVGTRPPP
jgi:chitinase